MTAPYDEDLAFVQARGFGELAAAAMATILPRLTERRARQVIDVGCGAGVTTKALVDAGFETLAIEPSASLLALARKAAPTARFQQASVYEVSLEPCDAILAVGEALTYHAPDDDADARLGSFIGEASRALRTGGTLVFDLIETGEPSLDARGWRSGSDWAVLYSSEEDAIHRRLTRHIETFRDAGEGSYRRRNETHHVRLFAREAVTSWLEQVGFSVRTATAYGSFPLPRRRVAFHATRR